MTQRSIYALQNTVIKAHPIDSTTITDPSELIELLKGEKVWVDEIAPETVSGHIQIKIHDVSGDWWAFDAHVMILPDELNDHQDDGKRYPANVWAMLDTIAHCEGTDKVNDGERTGYNIMFTYKYFTDFSDHPRQMNCSGGLCSDAAGRYQFLSTTWDELGLPDFTPYNQDEGAVMLIKRRNAYQHTLDGKVAEAMEALSWEWASLPPGQYGQPSYSLAEVERMFVKYGGTLYSQAPPPAPGGTRDIAVSQPWPYDWQRNNPGGNGDSECFASSVNMLLLYLGALSNIDDYHAIWPRFGPSTSAATHIDAVNSIAGFDPIFLQRCDSRHIIELIEAGLPCAPGWKHYGPSTAPTGGGHYSAIFGGRIEDNTLISTVHNDPYGDPNLVWGGWVSTSRGSGKELTYSRTNWHPRWIVYGQDAPNKGDGWLFAVKPSAVEWPPLFRS